MPRSYSLYSFCRYTTFGSPINGRSVNAGTSYAYGFNGKRNDLETGTQDYGMRIYNPSLGRFLSVDPLYKEYAYYSTYQFSGNDPIKFIDRDGLEPANPGEIEQYFKVVDAGGIIYFYNLKLRSISIFFDKKGTDTRAGYWWNNKYSGGIKSDAEKFSHEKISGIFNNALATEETGISTPKSVDEAEKFMVTKNRISGTSAGKMFRHIAAQAYLTIKYGEQSAKEFGDTYERYKGLDANSNFDLINNAIGRGLGKEIGGNYDFHTAEGVAGFLNKVVDITREKQGLTPLKDNEKIFSPIMKEVQALVIKAPEPTK